METRGRREPLRLGVVLPEVLRQAGPRRREELKDLSDAWCRAAGPEVARRSRVVGLARDTLTVSVESAALRQELESYRMESLLGRLSEEFPGKRIRKVRCVLKG